jgi:hypothetical protein
MFNGVRGIANKLSFSFETPASIIFKKLADSKAKPI